MINIFKTEQSVIRTIDAFEDGAWVQMVDPSVQELNKVSEAYDIEVSDLATALDEEESSRISLEDGYTLILVDIPSPEVRHEKKMYTTIPLGILIKQNAIITICKEDTPVLQYFIRNKVREFSTKKKMRFISNGSSKCNRRKRRDRSDGNREKRKIQSRGPKMCSRYRTGKEDPGEKETGGIGKWSEK